MPTPTGSATTSRRTAFASGAAEQLGPVHLRIPAGNELGIEQGFLAVVAQRIAVQVDDGSTGLLEHALGGGGIGIGLCADIVLASTKVFLRGGDSAIGLSPDLGSSYYLTRRAGASRAKYLLMSNRPASAQECLRMGIFDELHEPDALAAQALQLAEELAAGSTNSLAHIKKLCDEAHSHVLQAHLEAERYAISDCAGGANSLEGVNAFLEKRTPAFVRR